MSTQSSRGKVSRQCQHCGAEFKTYASYLKNGGGKFCSHACHSNNRKAATPRPEVVCATCKKVFKVSTYRAKTAQTCSVACRNARLPRSRRNPEDRFLDMVRKEGKCWVWTGAIVAGGYGFFGPGGRSQSVRAHRFSFEMYCSPIPPNMLVCHKCDNRACVNPVHLFLGTYAENSQDMCRKHRNMNLPQRKLTDDQAREIRDRYENSGASKRRLASEFGVSSTTITSVLRRNTFKHVE